EGPDQAMTQFHVASSRYLEVSVRPLGTAGSVSARQARRKGAGWQNAPKSPISRRMARLYSGTHFERKAERERDFRRRSDETTARRSSTIPLAVRMLREFGRPRLPNSRN